MKTKIFSKKAASLLAFILTAAIIIPLPIFANAAASVALTVTSATAAAGADVVISVNIPENSGVVCGDLLLKFNNTKLTVKSAVKGVAAQGLCSINPNYIPDGSGISTIKEAFATLDPITLGGSMMDITFTVLPGWTGSTTLALTADGFYITVDNIDIPITANVINGSITVPSSGTTETTRQTTTQQTTTQPAGTTKPGETTAQAGTTKPGDTTAATVPAATTAAPVKVDLMEMLEAAEKVGITGWGGDFVNLTPVQKDTVKDSLEDSGKTVEVKDDGFYYVETTAATTAAPVRVPSEEVSAAVEKAGITGWNGEIANLTPEQKDTVKENLEDNGKTVEVKDDGFYYVETTAETAAETTASASATEQEKNDSSSHKTSIIIVSVVFLVLAAAVIFFVIKKRK